MNLAKSEIAFFLESNTFAEDFATSIVIRAKFAHSKITKISPSNHKTPTLSLDIYTFEQK